MQVVTRVQNYNDEYIDISELVFNMQNDTTLQQQPEKISFDIIDDGSVDIKEGYLVTVDIKSDIIDPNTNTNIESKFFRGIIFSREFGQNDIISITAYTQERYLQNKDYYIVSGMTASDVFEKVCKDIGIKQYSIITPTNTILPPYIHDNESLYDVIYRGINYELFSGSQKEYLIRDNYGTLEFVDALSLISNFAFTDDNNIYDFKYSSSIDDNTYNQAKIIQENRVSKKGKPVKNGETVVSRDYGFDKDEENVQKWGILQYFGKSDKGYNQAQLDEFAKIIVSRYNKPSQSFSITCQGNPQIKAGSLIYIKLGKIEKEFKDIGRFIVEECSHSITNQDHRMTLKLRAPDKPSRYIAKINS